MQFASYGLVAIGSVLVDLGIFLTMTTFGMYYLYAQMISRISGGVFSYLLNRNWSFRRKGDGDKAVATLYRSARRFLLLYCMSYLLSLGSLWIAVEIVGFTEVIGKLSADAICFCFNFLAMKTYVFHERDGFISRFRGWLTKTRT